MPRKRKPKNRRFARRHVLDVKLRSSHRRRTRLRRLALMLILLVTLGMGGFGIWHGGNLLLAHFIYQNPAFTIHYLDIRTDGALSGEQLRRWAGVKRDDNLFALDLGRVKRDLELVPAIRFAALERVLPHTLKIRVTEREPVGEVTYYQREMGTRKYLLDAEGYVMFPLESYHLKPGVRTGTKYPRLIGVQSRDLRPGLRLRSPQARAALELVGTFNRSSMVGLERLLEIDVRSPGVLHVRTERGCRVTFGLAGFEGQLGRWRAVYDYGRRVGRRLTALDLSVENNLPAQWQNTEATPVRGINQPSFGRRNV